MTTDLAELGVHRRVIEQTVPLLDAIRSVAEMAFRRAQSRLASVQAYGDEVTLMLSQLVGALDRREREASLGGLIGSGPTALLVICGERGLCGPFNSRLVKQAVQLVADQGREDSRGVELLCWGSRGSRLLQAAGQSPLHTATLGSFALPTYLDVERLALELLDLVDGRHWSRVVVLHNVPLHGFQYQTVVSQLLPPDLSPVGAAKAPVEIKPSGDLPELATHLLTEYVLMSLYRAVVESATSEQLARIAAMKLARDNALRLLGQLTLEYQMAWQASVTASLLEVLTGYEVTTEG